MALTPPQKQIILALIDLSIEGGFGVYYPLAPIAAKLGITEPLYDHNTETGVLWGVGPRGENWLSITGDGRAAAVSYSEHKQLAVWCRYVEPEPVIASPAALPDALPMERVSGAPPVVAVEGVVSVGPGMDSLIIEHVLGWTYLPALGPGDEDWWMSPSPSCVVHRRGDLPAFSMEGGPMMIVLDAMRERYDANLKFRNGQAFAEFCEPSREYQAWAPAMPEAVCRAALKAVLPGWATRV